MKFGKFKWADSPKLVSALERFRQATQAQRWTVDLAPIGQPATATIRLKVETKK